MKKLTKLDIFTDLSENPEILLDKINEIVDFVNDMASGKKPTSDEKTLDETIESIVIDGTQYSPAPNSWKIQPFNTSTPDFSFSSLCCDCNGHSHLVDEACKYCHKHVSIRNSPVFGSSGTA